MPFAPGTFDVVLLLGSLYHLTDPAHRLLALRVAAPVVTPGALVAATTVNRLAALANRLQLNAAKPIYCRHSHAEEWAMLRTGPSSRHREGTFPTAYLHTPDQVASEFAQASLAVAGQYSVQRPACIVTDLAVLLDDAVERDSLLAALREFETEAGALQSGFRLLIAAFPGGHGDRHQI